MKNNNPLMMSENRIQLIVWSLLCLMPIVGMAVDLVAPSLPAIASSFQVSAKVAKGVISIYLLGYAFGNFFMGFLTDAWGRKKLLRLSLLSFVIVSLLPIIFTKIEVVLLARFLQGITIGAVAVLVRATISDVLPVEKLVRLGTLMGTMWGLGPVLGPVIGGYLQYYFGWKAGFCFFALVSVVGLITTFFIVPEIHFNRSSLNFKTIKTHLVEVFQHRLFMAMVILMGLMYSLIIAFNTLGPFLIQTKLSYTPIFFGHLAFCLGIIFLIATFVCRYCLKKYKIENLFSIILHLFLFISLTGLLVSYFLDDSLVLIIVTSALMFFACGFIFPMSMGRGLSFFRHISGTAAAIMYLFNILITSFVSFLVGFVSVQSAIPLMWVYFLLLFVAILLYWRRMHS